MKNLKKVLALVLAVSVLMGLATMASAKVTADYNDASSVNADRTEAVDVLSTLGVFQGSSGSFNPDAILTRAEAAKIICYMTMDKAEADKLVAGVAPYLDVPADHWAAGPIAYCKTQGIIAGVGNGNFDPMGQLTGLQFCKMLLTALGYDAATEGLIGSEWGNRTAAIAISDAQITDGISSATLAAPLSRQDACQLAFNTLTADMVRYETKASTVSSGGVTINLPGSTAKVRDAIAGRSYTVDGQAATNPNINRPDDELYTLQFCEYYFADLKRLDDDSNPLGMVTHRWDYKGEKIDAYAADLDKTVVVTDDRTGNPAVHDKTVFDIITEKSYMNYANSKITAGTRVFVNGNDLGTFAAGGAAADGDAVDVPVYRGDVVHSFVDNGSITRIVVARYQLAKIDDVTTDLTTGEKEAGAAYRIELCDLGGNGILTPRYYDDHNKGAAVLNGFDASTYTKGTVLAVAVDLSQAGERAIADSYVANVVSGKPTATKNEQDGYIRMGGQEYKFADTMSYRNNENGEDNLYREGNQSGVQMDENYDYNSEYKVYTTKENYVLGVEKVSGADLSDVRYVTGIHYVESSFGGASWYAQTVSMDGKVEDVQIELGTKRAIEERLQQSGVTLQGGGEFRFADRDGVNTKYESYKELQDEAAGLYIMNDRSYKNGSKAFGTIPADDVTGEAGDDFDQASNNGKKSLIWIGTEQVDGNAGPDYSDQDNSEPNEDDYKPFYLQLEDETLTGDLKYTDTKMKTTGGTIYIGSETRYVTIDSSSDGSLTAKAGTGSARAEANTIVYAISDRDSKNEPLVVVFVKTANNEEGVLGAANLVYLTGNKDGNTADDKYMMTAYFMKDEDGIKAMEEVTITCDQEDRGFYTYTKTGTGDAAVYELTEADTSAKGGVIANKNAEAGESPLAIQVLNTAGAKVNTADAFAKEYDDEDGGTVGASVINITKRGYMTGIGDNGDGNKFRFADLAIASGAKIVWVDATTAAADWSTNLVAKRAADPLDNDWDDEIDINSIGRMYDAIYCGEEALDTSTEVPVNKLLVDMYLEDGKAQFVAVVDWCPAA